MLHFISTCEKNTLKRSTV